MTKHKRTSQTKVIGVVGKPNTGKSTFFCATTLAPAKIASHPFTTITPNKGVGYIRTPCACKEFNVEDTPVNSLCLEGIRLVPVELIDCAGLVPGAWEGRGLGNQFLDEIRKADALIHIVDASGGTDSEGRVCEPGSHDPLEDVNFLEHEITMWMANIIKRDWNNIVRTVESESKQNIFTQLEERLSGLSINKGHVSETLRRTGLSADKPSSWSEEDLLKFSEERGSGIPEGMEVWKEEDLQELAEKRRRGGLNIPEWKPDQDMTECASCGYGLRPGWTKCPVCDAPIGEEPTENDTDEPKESSNEVQSDDPEEETETTDENTDL